MKQHSFKICLLALVLALLCTSAGCGSGDNTAEASRFDSKTHYYLQRKGIGYCENLRGDVCILFVWVDDALSTWNEADKQTVLPVLESGMETLETQAASYGVELSFSKMYTEAAIDIEADELENDWKNDALVAAGYKSVGETQQQLEKTYGVSSVPIVFLINRNGRAYAYSRARERGAESVVLYASDPYAFAHELLHLYGAEDLYVLDETVELAERLLPDSIMNDGDKIDDLTLYLIGWKTEITPAAEEFLVGTKLLTAEYIATKTKKDQHSGFGKMEWAGGMYNGELVAGIPQGQGTLTFDDGEYYDGEWQGGYFHGQGKYAWSDGEFYDGGWENGLRHGYGVYTWPDGTVYEGEWFANRIGSNGKMTYADGSYYEGEWANDKQHGYGVYVWSDGTRYEGEHADGRIAGKGKKTFPDGSYYDGEWKNGWQDGYGVYVWADGSRYEGNWQNDKMHGKGKLISPDGTVTEGRWLNGKLVE